MQAKRRLKTENYPGSRDTLYTHIQTRLTTIVSAASSSPSGVAHAQSAVPAGPASLPRTGAGQHPMALVQKRDCSRGALG